ncbi:hypothetical protein ACMYR2_2825 [Nitrobacter sp. TKz-YC01]
MSDRYFTRRQNGARGQDRNRHGNREAPMAVMTYNAVFKCTVALVN